MKLTFFLSHSPATRAPRKPSAYSICGSIANWPGVTTVAFIRSTSFAVCPTAKRTTCWRWIETAVANWCKSKTRKASFAVANDLRFLCNRTPRSAPTTLTQPPISCWPPIETDTCTDRFWNQSNHNRPIAWAVIRLWRANSWPPSTFESTIFRSGQERTNPKRSKNRQTSPAAALLTRSNVALKLKLTIFSIIGHWSLAFPILSKTLLLKTSLRLQECEHQIKWVFLFDKSVSNFPFQKVPTQSLWISLAIDS